MLYFVPLLDSILGFGLQARCITWHFQCRVPRFFFFFKVKVDFVIKPSLLLQFKLIAGFSEQTAEVQGQNKNAKSAQAEQGAAADS